MTVVDDAVTQPTGWQLSTTTAARQDALRRAAVAVSDAAAALAVAGVLSAGLHLLPARTALVVPAVWTIGAWSLGAYRHRRLKSNLVDLPVLIRTATLLCALAGVAAALVPIPGDRALVLLAVPVTGLASWFGRLALVPVTRANRRLAAAPVVVVGPADDIRDFLARKDSPGATPCRVAAACITDHPATYTGRQPEATVVAELAAHGLDTVSLDELPAAVQQVGADTVVVLGGLGPTALRSLAWELEGLSVAVAVTPLWLVAPHRIGVRMLGGATGIEVSPPQYYGTRLTMRGYLDRTVAAIALVAAAPLFAAVAIAIKATSPGGPVLFSQLRTGKHGRRFRLLKFRTMVPDAEALKPTLSNQYADGTLFKIKADPRITPVGRWLRKFSLDELPQLINVIRGDMVLVGPRPTSTPPELMRADYYRRTMVKPGLTGLWQVSGRSDLPWEDAVRLDVHYVENRSWELDLDIVFRTLPAVLTRRGAY